MTQSATTSVRARGKSGSRSLSLSARRLARRTLLAVYRCAPRSPTSLRRVPSASYPRDSLLPPHHRRTPRRPAPGQRPRPPRPHALPPPAARVPRAGALPALRPGGAAGGGRPDGAGADPAGRGEAAQGQAVEERGSCRSSTSAPCGSTTSSSSTPTGPATRPSIRRSTLTVVRATGGVCALQRSAASTSSAGRRRRTPRGGRTQQYHAMARAYYAS